MGQPFHDAFFGGVTRDNFVILLLSLTTAVAVGFHKLSSVPIIISLAGLIGNLSGYLGYAGYISNKGSLIALRTIGETCWNIQETIAVFYSYFLLERILYHNQGGRRNSGGFGRLFCAKYFFPSFWFLTIVNIGARVAITVMYLVWWVKDGYSNPDYKHDPFFVGIETVSLIFFLVTALTEILTGSFLIQVFRVAVQSSETYCGGQKVGLFKQMVLSTEIRVTSLAVIGITRATVARIKNNNEIATQFEFAMWHFGNLYAMVLILDLLMARMSAGRYVKVDKNTRAVIGETECTCGVLQGVPGSFVSQPLESEMLKPSTKVRVGSFHVPAGTTMGSESSQSTTEKLVMIKQRGSVV